MKKTEKKARRQFPLAQKRAIIREAIERRSVAEVLTKHRISDGTFYRWVRLYEPNWDTVFNPKLPRRRTGRIAPHTVVRTVPHDVAARLAELEKENAQLRRLYMDLVLARDYPDKA